MHRATTQANSEQARATTTTGQSYSSNKDNSPYHVYKSDF